MLIFPTAMWEIPAVRPYEGPLTKTPEGTVPRSGLSDINKGSEEAAKLKKEDRKKKRRPLLSPLLPPLPRPKR